MTPPVQRTGPVLAIVGSCGGCEHLLTGVGGPRLGRGPHAACVHPSRPGGGLIFGRARGPWPMPADCPELGPARLALARAIVAAAEPQRSYQGPMPFVEDEDAPRSRRPSDEEEPSR